MTSEHENQNGNGRRSFLNWIWAGLGAIVTVELVWMVTAFIRSRPLKGAGDNLGGIVTAGPVEEFEKNSVTAFPRGRFYLSRLADGGFLAVSRQCTHLGCTVPWIAEEKQFKCPCHASVFDITGNVMHSPASRALDLFPIRIVNDVVKVDTRRRLRRSEYRKEQVVYPKAGTNT